MRLPDVPAETGGREREANVFARDGTVIWSSTPGFAGRSLGPNRELEEALEGELAIESGTVGVEDKPEHVAFAAQPGLRFVETYVPIWGEDRGGVVAVVEIYRQPRALFAAIPMSTPITGWAQEDRLLRLGFDVMRADVKRDIDTVDDLVAVADSCPQLRTARLAAALGSRRSSPRHERGEEPRKAGTEAVVA